ncbi:hypothetical protein FM071_05845 [Sulfurimonas paralvinellae]|uniref:Glycosyltransferase RgtA/B/C/D-like domain-containing protein n=1 Tax=Sulfurimonas paralvinellae TaxID=317658 RepID=A0A7M1B843_9BACT|nr:hypothetical protein FM071_05845 [Sulfurimonas paralvinellae]
MVDQWYWLKYRDAARKQKKCPPELPEYLLEVKQWYPPFFGCFLSILPDDILNYSAFITQFLSFFRLILIVLFGKLIGIEFSTSIFVAIMVYLTAPILIYYDNQINSRIFGSILLDILILFFFGYFEYELSYMLLPIVLLTILLILTHKMSHQLYVFLLIGLSVFYTSLIPIFIYIFANIIAFLFFNYKNYLKHHIEIVKFWHRNRYKLGSHQFYESNIYGKKDFVHVNRVHGNGLKSVIKKLSLIIGMLPFTIFVIFSFELNFFGLVFFMTMLFILLTSFVDKFLCLGSGNLYTYNLVTIISFYVIYTDIYFADFTNQILLLIISVMTAVSIFKFYKGLKNKSRDKDFEDAIDFLKNSDLDRVMVIPFQLPDEVTYKTSKKVFWGGHGYGFLWLEPYFPVMNVKIEKAMKDWNLGAIFLKKDYWREFFEKVNMNLFHVAFENEKYIILKVKNWKNGEKIPQWAIKKYSDIFGRLNV